MAIDKQKNTDNQVLIKFQEWFKQEVGHAFWDPQLMNSICSKEEMPQKWKQSATAPIYRKGDKTECSNYSGLSLLPTT
jgi:hypothetical protein